MPKTIETHEPLPTARIYITLKEAVYPGCNKVVLLTIEDYHSGKVKEMYAKAFDPKDYADLRLVQLSIDQYHRIRDYGIIPAGEHIELLDGIMFWVDQRASAKEPLPVEVVALTVDQYHRMLEIGVFEEGVPIELINGLLVWKDRSARGEDPMTIGDYHRLVMMNLMDLAPKFKTSEGGLYLQQPTTIPSVAEPEPDAYVLRGLPKDYQHEHPRPNSLWCAIEVSDSSLRSDRKHKMKLYAHGGIPQYVIVNLPDMQVEVYERPSKGKGTYAEQTFLHRGEKVSFVVGKQRRIKISVESILP